MPKRFHKHKGQGPFCLFINISCLFINITSRVCVLFVASINTMLTVMSHHLLTKTVLVSGKYRKQSWVSAEVIWPIHSFHVKNIKFDCLNLLLKPEKGKIFRKNGIFYLTEFFTVITVTDRKCIVADNVVLATIVFMYTVMNVTKLEFISYIYKITYAYLERVDFHVHLPILYVLNLFPDCCNIKQNTQFGNFKEQIKLVNKTFVDHSDQLNGKQ